MESKFIILLVFLFGVAVDKSLAKTPQGNGEANSGNEPSDAKKKPMNACPEDKRDCDKGYTLSSDSSTCHKLNNDRLTHDQSEEVCVKEGGHLLIINSEAERKAIKDLLKVGTKTSYMRVGLKKKDGKWMTVTGQSLESTGFAKWDSGEPNGKKETEICGGIYRGSVLLSDLDCKEKRYTFICEKMFKCTAKST